MNSEITRIHSYLVHPAKGESSQPIISGAEILKSNTLFEILSKLFQKTPKECNIDIVFNKENGSYINNEFRAKLIGYLSDSSLENGRTIAQRLQDVTTLRSGLGLLFIITGKSNGKQTIVLSRFPADQGIIAEERDQNLIVKAVEDIFMKNAKAYKSVIFESDSLGTGFIDGKAIDKQVNRKEKELSDYWTVDFLKSSIRTTSLAGTKRFAEALENSIKEASTLNVKRELIAASILVTNYAGQKLSTNQIIRNLNLSQEALLIIEKSFSRKDMIDDVFEFNLDEFDKHIIYHSVELDNGAVLIANYTRFDDVFNRQVIDGDDNEREQFTTAGRVINEILRKSK